MRRWFPVLAMACLLSTAAGVADVRAQPRASERARVSQVVNGTTITVDYSRPVARGRTNLFGGVVHWGELWTPGANWATTFEVDKPVLLNGHEVEAGTYSVWIHLDETRPWTVILNRSPRLYHDEPVPEEDHVLSFDVQPEQGPHMEALAWYFPVVGPREATLRMHWGTTVVPLAVTTHAFEPAPLAPGLAARYAGAYAVSGRDPTTGGPMEFTLTLTAEGETLAGRWGRAPIALVPVSDQEFRIGFLRNGALFDVGDEMTVRMVMDGGRATAIELVWEGREAFARGARAER